MKPHEISPNKSQGTNPTNRLLGTYSQRKELALSFIKDFFSRLRSGGKMDAHLYWMYVECGRCHEKIRFHVDMRNDLSIQYGETEKEDVYFTRKRIIGSQGCFQTIDVELTFDKNRRLLDQQITGGRFISQEESATQDSPS
jgi:hypothetical protein